MTGTAAEFSDRVRAWLAAHAPRDEPGHAVDIAAAKRFQASLHDAGFAGITWPVEYGGQGLGTAEQRAFEREAQEYDLPFYPFMIGLGMCGPTLLDLGTEAQKTRYLPPMLRGEEIWCQLFSEPGAGSDVASLQTRAVRDGDGWVVTGQKVWTSVAQWADYGVLIARTDVTRPKHLGISMFIVDMRAPDVTVQPLRDMTGGATFNEVFFDGARIPTDALIGQVNQGWQAAVTMLSHERVSIGTRGRRRVNPTSFAALAEVARARGVHADPVVRQRLADLYVQERVLELFGARLRQEATMSTTAGRPPGPRGSVAKLAGALLARQGAEVAGLVAGPDAVAWEPGGDNGLAVAISAAPASGIAGGTNEIQRGIIGERVLGLPKEPQVDRDVPFEQLKVGT